MHPAEQVAEFIREAVGRDTLVHALANAPSPDASYRLVSEILSGRKQFVQDRSADEIFTTLGRPDLYQLL